MLKPHDGWEERVREGFARQRIMATLGVSIAEIGPGRAVLQMPYSIEFSQQHGYLHAGAVATLADSACGYAAYTMAPAGHTVLTVEFKINLMAPAQGATFVAEGTLLRAGRTLSVCTATVTASGPEQRRAIAQMQATIMLFEGTDE